MENTGERPGPHRPAIYQIRVQGELGERWAASLDDMTITVERGMTTLTGTIVDQPALHGLLIKIRDLGLTLVSVNCLEDNLREASGQLNCDG